MSAPKIFLSLLILALIAFLPSLKAGFNSDDQVLIRDNAQLESIDGLGQIWQGKYTPDYWPLSYTNFWVQKQFWGNNPFPYHCINIFVQALNGFLLFLILRKLAIHGAWWAAAIFTIHPVQVESVAWLVEMKNLQSGCFFFLSILCYLHFDEKEKKRHYLLSFFFFLLALLSKSSTLVLPVVLWLLAWWKNKHKDPQIWYRIIPYFLLGLISAAVTLWFQIHGADAQGADWSAGILERALIASRAVWFYLGKIVFPLEVSFNYPRWTIDTGSFFAYLPALAIITVAAWLHVRRNGWGKDAGFAFGYFLLLLFPVLGFFNMYFMRFTYVTDRWQYLAMVGPIAFFVSVVTIWFEKHGRMKAGMITGMIVIACLSFLSWQQSSVYRTPETLWRDTLEKNPRSPLANLGLAYELSRQNKFAESAAYYQNAVNASPNYLEAQNGLGDSLYKLGKKEEAKIVWAELLRQYPFYAPANRKMGDLLLAEEKYKEAIRCYSIALQKYPNWKEVQIPLARALQKEGMLDQATQELWLVQQKWPADVEAFELLGDVLKQQGKMELANRQYQKAIDNAINQNDPTLAEKIRQKLKP